MMTGQYPLSIHPLKLFSKPSIGNNYNFQNIAYETFFNHPKYFGKSYKIMACILVHNIHNTHANFTFTNLANTFKNVSWRTFNSTYTYILIHVYWHILTHRLNTIYFRNKTFLQTSPAHMMQPTIKAQALLLYLTIISK